MFLKKHGKAVYLFGCVAFALCLLLCAFIEKKYSLGDAAPVQVGFRLAVIIGSALFVRRGEYRSRPAAAASRLAFGLIAVAASALGNIYTPNSPKSVGANLWFAFAILVTTVSEEMYFRAVGVKIFETVDGVRISRSGRGCVILCLGAALPYIITGFGGGIFGLMHTLLIFSLGILSLGMYCCCRNIAVSCIIHFLLNYLSGVFAYNTSDEAPALGLIVYFISYTAVVVYNIVMGIRLLKKSVSYGG